MLPLRVKDTTRVLSGGKEHRPLAIRDEVMVLDGCPINVMTSAWEPTPAELSVLLRGGSVRLSILGTSHPPVMMSVEEPPEL
jgi:hypothetical protein